ncbi:hypothetical protein BV25DRAFT_1899023 [Artomyces pyxidatus]|uniref:Uncharacterized protein n=1 Tax=Artomyces pyxidatus TaxID=48021 RepID=A0ACB8T6N8_9AGAM|nr:hypothetical protein BV25DRAFT_1899023 [Artomyces pyxidatus]
MSATPPSPNHPASLILPSLLGTLVNWLLYGVLVVQVYLYDFYFSTDRLAFKYLVYTVFLIETIQTIFTGADLGYWLAAGFGDYPRLAKPFLSVFDTPVLSSIVSCIVQVFFCYRIWILKKSLLWLCIIIGTISFIQMVGGMACRISVHVLGDIGKAHEKGVVAFAYLWLLGDAVADLMIAFTMSYFLIRTRQGPHEYSSHILSRVLRLTVETNIVSSTIAISSIVLYAAAPGKTYYFGPTAVIGKIYSNTLLVMFNNRIGLRDVSQKAIPSDTSFPSRRWGQSSVPVQYNPGSESFELSAFKNESTADVKASGQPEPGIMDIRPSFASQSGMEAPSV